MHASRLSARVSACAPAKACIIMKTLHNPIIGEVPIRIAVRLLAALTLFWAAGPAHAGDANISLDEAVRRAIESNLSLRVGTFTPAISAVDVRRARTRRPRVAAS